jgi:hypothetical protein
MEASGACRSRGRQAWVSRKGGGQVDAQDPFPLTGVIVIDAAQEGGEGGAVGQAIQPAQFPPDRSRDGGIVRLVSRLQVQGQDRGLWGATRGNPIIERPYRSLFLVREDEGGAVGRAGAGDGGAQAVGGTRDEDDAAGEEVRGGLIIFHKGMSLWRRG